MWGHLFSTYKAEFNAWRRGRNGDTSHFQAVDSPAQSAGVGRENLCSCRLGQHISWSKLALTSPSFCSHGLDYSSFFFVFVSRFCLLLPGRGNSALPRAASGQRLSPYSLLQYTAIFSSLSTLITSLFIA